MVLNIFFMILNGKPHGQSRVFRNLFCCGKFSPGGGGGGGTPYLDYTGRLRPKGFSFFRLEVYKRG